jgi:hypothetical protein
MKSFWRYQIRYRLARRLIHMGLWMMPEGRYKDDMINGLWDLYDRVFAQTASPHG